MYKSMHDSARTENCECGELLKRIYTSFSFYGEKLSSAEFNPAFGKIINNKNHLKEVLAKHRDQTGSEMIEVGNENLEKLHSDSAKRQEQKREDSWRKVEEELGLPKD